MNEEDKLYGIILTALVCMGIVTCTHAAFAYFDAAIWVAHIIEKATWLVCAGWILNLVLK